jgi:hypothetical protein
MQAHRVLVALGVLAIVFMASGQTYAQAQQAPAQPGAQAPAQPPADKAPPAQAQASTAQGELSEVDAKTNTLTVKTAAADMKFTYNDQTKVAGGKGVAGLATMTGSQVTVQYRKEGASNIATNIEVREKK